MTVALLGECMIEFSPGPDGRYAAGYGGDTLNTAVYLARLGVQADYVTALGDDPFSDQMLASWSAEGVGTRHAIRVAGALPGLYIIRREPGGDRSFHYWRQQAPVRQFFSRPEAKPVLSELAQYDWLYLSGITLSLFTPDNLPALFAALDGAIAGGCRIAFDGNYRAKGWPDIAAARAAFNQVLDRTALALPTLSDEQALFGDADAGACVARLRAHGIPEIVIKRGGEPCVIATETGLQEAAARPGIEPVDTTAAGDAFNAGYLAGRIAGLAPALAAAQGHALAGAVIQHRGAIIPRSAMPELQQEALF
jgi:2-dehydro-3-deoxygluconokinase